MLDEFFPTESLRVDKLLNLTVSYMQIQGAHKFALKLDIFIFNIHLTPTFSLKPNLMSKC